MSATSGQAPRRPKLARTLIEFAALLDRTTPSGRIAAIASGAPRGDGHAVLVLPTSLNTDLQTKAFRDFLARIGYRPHAWGLGRNMGPTQSVMRELPRMLNALAEAHGPVSLVGFSMGGLFARWLAIRHPAQVRAVITVCSPFRDAIDSVFFRIDGLVDRWGPDTRALADEIAGPFAAPATFIYTRDDGVVAWESCVDPERPADNVETHGPHVTIARNPDVFRIAAERLARQPAA